MQLVLWTAGVVVLTLAVNAPIIPGLVGRLGLLDIPLVKRRMRAKAARSLLRFSGHAVHDLQADPDEMLRGEPRFNAKRCCARQMHACLEKGCMLLCLLGLHAANAMYIMTA